LELGTLCNGCFKFWHITISVFYGLTQTVSDPKKFNRYCIVLL